MKTLIQKELRENFKLALLGAAIFAFLLATMYHQCTRVYYDLAMGNDNGDNGLGYPGVAQPLLGDIPKVTLFFGAVLGAILGWFQIHNERHRDLWAFLVHRPMSRSQIFAAKIIAGLGLYVLGMALPLVGVIIAIVTPGHVAAPFEPAMLLSVTACFFSGVAFYFAGMLTSLRQARWYVSRGMGLGLAFLVALGVFNVPHFWQAMVIAGLGGAVLATAAWGGYLTGGIDEGQPPAGRGALALSLTMGCFIVMMLGASLIQASFPHLLDEPFEWSRYQMTKDGMLYQVTHADGKPAQITALDGAVLPDRQTGKPMTLETFNRMAAPETSLVVKFPDPAKPEKWGRKEYAEAATFFTFWRQTHDTLWYWNRNGRLWAYDIGSRRFLGSLGPNGFTPGVAAGADYFLPGGHAGAYYNGYSTLGYPARTLRSDSTVYKLDLDNRAVSAFFSAPKGELIGGAYDIAANGADWSYTLVADSHTVQLVNPDGTARWQMPLTPAYPDYNGVTVSLLGATNCFAVWFMPSYNINETKNWALPVHVAWLGADGKVLDNTNLPYLAGHATRKRVVAKTLALSAIPPAFYLAPGFVNGRDAYKNIPVREFSYGLVVAAICTVIGWYVGRRNYFTAGSQVWWSVFHFCFGVPGLLAFFCLQEWPGREACPECRRLRFVNRERCEHCGAPFAPPAKNGTEIFAPLQSAGTK